MTPLEQMFEIALRTKSISARRFALEWAEFEAEYEKHKTKKHKDIIEEDKVDIIV